MVQSILFFCTGIVLFLFGMIRLSATVQHRFTNYRLREYFRLSVKTPAYGVITGIVSTILFQSSSATSVLAVGLVSAGLISFFHSLGIILGADIGTTLTVQLVVWKFTDISPVFIILGSIVWVSGKNKWKYIGETIFYFGLIFFGLGLVSMATEPLKNSPVVVHYLQEVKNPFLGVLIGLAITAIIQSSAIPVSILAILAQYNLVTIEASLPIVFGANLGTAVTALLAGLTANINGKRSAVSHFLFKLFGVLIALAILPFFILSLKSMSVSVAQQIALGHFFFNLLIVIIFIPLLKPFARLIERFMPGKEEILSLWPEYLDEKYLLHAEDAFNCARKELKRQIAIVQNMFSKSADLISNFSDTKKTEVDYIEFVVDTLRREIGNYLCKISETSPTPESSRKLFLFSQIADDTERIGDHALSLAELSERKHRRKIKFTEMGMSDLKEFEALVAENLEDTATLIDKRDEEIINRIFARENQIDTLEKELKERHLERFYKGICQAEAGPIFVEMLIDLERISDHCENIAEYIQDLKES
jgi:phosphate:Na+ symporter